MTPVFDLFSFVRSTYVILWRERAYLVRLAAVPVLIIMINVVAVTMADDMLTPLRRGLCLIPAMMAEAWLVAQFLRTLMTGERWPMPVPDDVRRGGPIPLSIRRRVRGLLSAMISYMLIINYRLVHAAGIIYRFRCGRDGLASVLAVFGLFCIVEVSCLGVMITRNPCYIVF